jgi:hypothetical protein
MQALYTDFTPASPQEQLLAFPEFDTGATRASLSGFGPAVNQAFYCAARSPTAFAYQRAMVHARLVSLGSTLVCHGHPWKRVRYPDVSVVRLRSYTASHLTHTLGP